MTDLETKRGTLIVKVTAYDFRFGGREKPPDSSLLKGASGFKNHGLAGSTRGELTLGTSGRSLSALGFSFLGRVRWGVSALLRW